MKIGFHNAANILAIAVNFVCRRQSPPSAKQLRRLFQRWNFEA
jgi:hypothetical protein